MRSPQKTRDLPLVAANDDEMDLGGITLRFLSVKGHSVGAISARVPEREALFVSDSLGFRFPGRGVLPLFFTNYADYTATLDKFGRLDCAILGPAHQGPIVGREAARAAVAESLAASVKLRERIRSFTGTPDDLSQGIFEECYVDELTMYTRENILNCVKLLIKRARE